MGNLDPSSNFGGYPTRILKITKFDWHKKDLFCIIDADAMGVVRLFLFKAQSSTPIKIHDPIRKGELTADKFGGVEDVYVQKLDN